MAERFAVGDLEAAVKRVQHFVVKTKFENMLNKQVCQSVVAEIKYLLSCIEISMKSEDEAKSTLQKGFDAIKFEEIKDKQEKLFREILSSNDYRRVLKVFNEKGIASQIGQNLGIDNRQYQDKVINLLRGDSRDRISDIFSSYLPAQIPTSPMI